MKHKKPLVSVVIPVKNGSETVRECLDGVIKQTYRNIEITLVDNFSSDGTPDIIQGYIKKDKRVKLLYKGPERSTQMNFGIGKAKGKYVFVTSADMVMDKDFIELAVKKCEEEGFQVCNGHIISRTGGFWSRVKGMERDMYVNDKLMETALFYRKDLFLKLGGFDERMVGVEEDFQHKLDEMGYKTGIIDSYQTHIDELDSLREIVLKSFYYGLYDSAYFRKRPLLALKKRFPLRGAFVRNYKMLFGQLDLLIGFIIFKIIQYTAGTIGLFLGLVFSPEKRKIQKLIYEKK